MQENRERKRFPRPKAGSTYTYGSERAFSVAKQVHPRESTAILRCETCDMTSSGPVAASCALRCQPISLGATCGSSFFPCYPFFSALPPRRKDITLMFANAMAYVDAETSLFRVAQEASADLRGVLLEHCPAIPSHYHLIAALPLANTTLIVAPNISMAKVRGGRGRFQKVIHSRKRENVKRKRMLPMVCRWTTTHCSRCLRPFASCMTYTLLYSLSSPYFSFIVRYYTPAL